MTDELLKVKQRFGIIGNSDALNHAIDVAVQVAPTDLSVLVTGESGSGKEFFPQIIHLYSARKHGPYQPVNCAAIPEGTIDSELFGHEKGSFTGAIAERKGYFEVADGGTVFLDEVADLPSSTQARLLRVLESGEFMRVGSSKVLKTNVRIVAATNKDMSEAIKSGRFRADLYYRLNAIPIQVPPLRERPDDILRLFRKFTGDVAERYRMPAVQLSEEAKKAIVAYRWPGNIRELKNVAERVAVLAGQREVSAEMLKSIFDTSFDTVPALFHPEGPSGESTFANEREILWKVMFDMQKDIQDLKNLMNDLCKKPMETAIPPIRPIPQATDFGDAKDVTDELKPVAGEAPLIVETEPQVLSASVASAPVFPKASYHKDKAHIQDASEYVEETLSLEDLEKDAIRKALDRNNGRRKAAAADLNISERTLYRKIKEYQLD